MQGPTGDRIGDSLNCFLRFPHRLGKSSVLQTPGEIPPEPLAGMTEERGSWGSALRQPAGVKQASAAAELSENEWKPVADRVLPCPGSLADGAVAIADGGGLIPSLQGLHT